MWRIMKDPQKKTVFGTSSMFAGLHIIEVVNEAEIRLLGNLENAERLTYGFDWHPTDEDTFAFCTFYDKKLSLAKATF